MAALIFTAACHERSDSRASKGSRLPPATVRVAAAECRSQVLVEEIAATVRAKTRATLEAKLSGRIRDLPVVVGQVVKKGDRVARLDAAETQARLEQARATLQQADRDWTRVSALFKGQAVTRSEYDRAEAQERLAKASVAEAEAMMEYAEVLAPFDGVISRKWADVGDLASPGKPLVEMEDPSQLQLEADVPESMAGKIQLGAILAMRLDGLQPDLETKVTEIAPSADSASRTVQVKTALAVAPGVIPGRFARLRVPTGEGKVLTVPAVALVQRGQLEMVFVVTNREAHLCLVKSGKRLGDQVAIQSGLAAGQIVAVDGAGLLTDGQTVEVR